MNTTKIFFLLAVLFAFFVLSCRVTAQGRAEREPVSPDSSFTLPSTFGGWFTNGQKESRDCGSYSFMGFGVHLRVALLGNPERVQLFGRGSGYLDTDVNLSYDLALGAAFLKRLQVLAGYSWPAVAVCGEGDEAGQSIGNRGGFMFGVAYGITGLYAEVNHVWYTVPAAYTAENPDTERDATGFAFRLGYAIAL